jgi:predicted MPP superfamily phosphohydrolase
MSAVTKILFLTAGPSDKPTLQLEEEFRLVDQRIRRGGYQHLFSLRLVPGIRATELPFELMTDPPDILHFSGHGSSTGELYFVDGPAGNAHPVPGATLAKLFQQFRDRIKCVVLNACWSTVQAKAIVQSIPCVVGLSRDISDRAAIAFAAGFYEALAFGKTVKEAFDLGVIQLELAFPNEVSSDSGVQLMFREDVNPATMRIVSESSGKSTPTAQIQDAAHSGPDATETSTGSNRKTVPRSRKTEPVAIQSSIVDDRDGSAVRGRGAGSLTWLHVSDLHFGHGDAHYRFDQSGVTSAIIRNAESMARRIGPPDLIFVTGDIAFSGQPAQYQQAKEWLGRLRSAVGGSPRLFLVPGNHDVDRKLAMKLSAAAIHKELRAEPRKLDELLSDHTEMQPLWPKLFAYAEFATEVGSPSISADKPFYIEEVSCPLGGKLRIAGLNTALLSFDNDDSPKNLGLGRGQILKAIEEQPTDALLLVLEHHPEEWLLDGKALVAQLQQRAHIQFSGHVHNQHGVVHVPLLGGSRLQFVAGAGHKDQNEEGCHSYAWGQLSEEGLAYYSWVWQPDRMAFALATMIDTDDFKHGDHAFVERARLPKGIQNWLLSSSQKVSPRRTRTSATKVTSAGAKKKADPPGSSTVASQTPSAPSAKMVATPAAPLRSPALDELKKKVQDVLRREPALVTALIGKGYGATGNAGVDAVASVTTALTECSAAHVAGLLKSLAKNPSLLVPARTLLWHILPLIGDWEQLLVQSQTVGTKQDVLELPLRTTTLAEVVMARVDARSCLFSLGSGEVPEGTLHIPLPSPTLAPLFDLQGHGLAQAVLFNLFQEQPPDGIPPDSEKWRSLKKALPDQREFSAAVQSIINNPQVEARRYLLFIDGLVKNSVKDLDAAWTVTQKSLQDVLPGLRLVRLKGGHETVSQEFELIPIIKEVRDLS